MEKVKKYSRELDNKIKKRTYKDILMHWIDAVPYEDSVEWNILNEKRKQAFEFKFVYSSVPQTRACAKIIATGKDYFDDSLYESDIKNISETKLYNILTDSGYGFHSIGTAMHAFPIDEELMKHNFVDVYRTPATFVLWLAKIKLAQSSKPEFILLHHVLETHTPYYSGDMETLWCPTDKEDRSKNEYYEDIRRTRYNYLEKNILAFQNCVNEMNTTTIYMSDHGRATETNVQWEDSRCRPFCFINGGVIKPGSTDRIFEYKKMADCIKKIITNNQEWDDITDTYALVKAEDYYSKHYCDNLLRKQLYNDYQDDTFMTHMQFRAVCTKDDKFIRYPIKDIYVRMPDEQIIDIEKVDPKRIEYLQLLCGDNFIDIFHNEKYKKCVETYEKLGLVKNETWIQRVTIEDKEG